VFNVNAREIATATAIALHADKLLFLTDQQGLRNGRKQLIRQLNPTEARQLLQSRKKLAREYALDLQCAIDACSGHVRRVHLIDRHVNGGLLLELFTRDGIGTLITSETYEGTRRATIEDVGGILELISPLEADGVLVKRSREQLELEISHFHVVERDGAIIACAALYPMGKQYAELACLAVDAEYRKQGRGDTLLEYMEKQAQAMRIAKLFVLTTQTTHWFRERGFSNADIKALPVKRRALYNYQRNSRVMVKTLD
jgi:amino-acid N-acetyltransferase